MVVSFLGFTLNCSMEIEMLGCICVVLILLNALMKDFAPWSYTFHDPFHLQLGRPYEICQVAVLEFPQKT